MILPEQPEDAVIPLLNRLRRKRALARVVLIFEAVWPAIWPALGAAGGFVVLALLDLPRRLPPTGHSVFLAATAIAVAALLIRGLRRLTWPDANAVDRRLERATGLSHRPLATIADRLGAEDPRHCAARRHGPRDPCRCISGDHAALTGMGIDACRVQSR